jgi:hypothetical protein
MANMENFIEQKLESEFHLLELLRKFCMKMLVKALGWTKQLCVGWGGSKSHNRDIGLAELLLEASVVVVGCDGITGWAELGTWVSH